MSSVVDTESKPAQGGGSRLWRPPYVGLVTTLIMLFAIGLGHAAMRSIEEALGRDNTYIASIAIGFAGIIALWYGVKSRSENFATWIGFGAGLLLWMSWVEFFSSSRPQDLRPGSLRTQSGEVRTRSQAADTASWPPPLACCSRCSPFIFSTKTRAAICLCDAIASARAKALGATQQDGVGRRQYVVINP